ncbi:MAG: hypothetical protein A3F84_19125 [Candidatus Handelsmanbacteria bacterium RIFCSPLOWO2_12_FULL_64_10]|uniref:Citrate transporter-like domain-containing protein n=1 Tax=Handelsmanbacteria sp. (strain RIFCSPLOWO2_12_FULL_64_10) TaxID=1817868 RepID=A0A1F6C8M3_HANXR|nr:MAG: hypothetical protein A3F84_19125 [Candidatus Handelsmanbacteria bacterium RIFCSPLOWO2_12_FULL_64_10]
MDPFVTSSAIFLGTYALIASERVHRTVAALLGAVALLLFHVLEQEEAFHAVDFNVIFLLMSMMIVVGILKKTGVFQWLALKAAKLGRGHPAIILALMCLLTGVLSAFLDNVTTVVLTVPMTLFIVRLLEVDPIPFLVGQVLASNIGGTGTLIGDPPNIMIGSRAGMDFLEFTRHAAPIAVALLVLYCVGMALFWLPKMKATAELRAALMEQSEEGLITDPRLLRIGAFVLALTVAGFLLHGPLGYEAATIALASAVLFLLLSRQSIQEVLIEEVEWTSLLFFVGLFIVVEGLVQGGVIASLAHAALALTGGSLPATTLLILWMSGILSAIVDNIPYTATMLPLVEQLGLSMPILPLWVALFLGADLGGNATIIGASANVVVAGMAERQGYPFSFWRFMKFGVPVTVVNLMVCTGYLWVRYLA